jgi:hypothetical protein
MNFFDKNKLEWKYEFKIEQKFQNFHKCRFQKRKSSIYQWHIVETNVLVAFSSLANARLAFKTVEDNTIVEYVFRPGSLLDTIIPYHFTSVFKFETYVLVVPPGQLYSNYEKVFLPFDLETWLCLIATFAGAFLSIFMINNLSKNIRDLLYGKGVYTPSFNVISIFFGMGQVKLPTGNFARIILIIFILFCLVIRNAYQGVQFEMLTKEMRRRPAQTIQDLIDWNFEILCNFNSNNIVKMLRAKLGDSQE